MSKQADFTRMIKKRKFYFGSMAMLWLLSGMASCGESNAADSGRSGGLSGAVIFEKNCKICHGSDGRLGMNGAKDLSISILKLSERVNVITNGRNMMTPFGKILSPDEIDSVATFTLRLKQ